ncbi:MAG: hypothetical protein EXS12_04845 [Phycisphaerales bacterium]|nr:hypothetical protein [Phycisphaerales bacterium]
MKLKTIMTALPMACAVAFVLIQISTPPPISKLSATNPFGITQENQTEVFVASDVSQAVAQGVKKTLSSRQPHMDAANNGGAEWGIHRLSSSLPLGFSSALDIAGEGDQITILHEYWNSVQRSILHTQDQSRGQE